MSDSPSKMDVVKILVNLDTLSAGHVPAERLAWAHLFVACGLIQRTLPNPELLTRERFTELAGKVHDTIFKSLHAQTRN